MTQTAQNVKPLYDKVLIKRLESEQTTQGGIIIPETAQEKTQLGQIVSAGDGKVDAQGNLRALKVKSGDTVLFGKYSGTEIKLGNDDYLILREEEILGIVENK